MIKDKTLDLIKGEENDFKKLFSVCVVKPYAYQRRFIDYIGAYKSWNTSVKEGVLTLDDKKYNVEYIGTTSNSDNFWYSAEREHVIPDEYVKLTMEARKKMEGLHIDGFSEGKIELDDEGGINGYDISMIYMAFAPANTAYFKGQRRYFNLYVC